MVALPHATLSALAGDYAKDMTSIRSRRVQRLLVREFAGAQYVLTVQFASGTKAVLGVSASGAAFCATDGKGKHVSVVKWLHRSAQGLETRFDLLKDSLPVVSSESLLLANLHGQGRLHVRPGSLPPRARALVSLALEALTEAH